MQCTCTKMHAVCAVSLFFQLNLLFRVFLQVPEHIVLLLIVRHCNLLLFWSWIVFCLLFLLFYVIRSPVLTEGTTVYKRYRCRLRTPMSTCHISVSIPLWYEPFLSTHQGCNVYEIQPALTVAQDPTLYSTKGNGRKLLNTTYNYIIQASIKKTSTNIR